MPIIRDFVYQDDEDTGLIGLMPRWMPNANTTYAVAHDILEHFMPNGLTAGEDELEALGALLALRIENGVFNGHLSDVDQLAAVVSSTLCDIVRDELPLLRPCPSRALHEDYIWAEELIQRATSRALELSRKELDDQPLGELFEDERALARAVIGYLRRGYRKTLRRFEGCDLYTLGNSLFKKLNSASKRLVESELLQLGDQVRVLVDPRNASVRFKVNGHAFDDF